MRIARIYCEGDLTSNQNVTLSQETSHYLQHVLRVKIGTNLIIFNGLGGEYEAAVMAIQKKSVTVTTGAYHGQASDQSCQIHLAQGIGKGDKMDWIVQKAVELGVSEITPLMTDFCNVRLDEERAAKRNAHWQKIIISACEQSGRTLLPKLNPIISLADWIHQDETPLKIVCHPGGSQRLKSLPVSKAVTILIGPEGGLSDDEIVAATASGFQQVDLGPRILRTETAAVAVLGVVQSLWGDG